MRNPRVAPQKIPLVPLPSRGIDAYRKNFEAWSGAVDGPIDFLIQDLQVTVGDGIAFCHCLGRVRSTRRSAATDYRVRVTAGLQAPGCPRRVEAL
jgi:ketosteroid isomerase-like protein